MSKKSKRTAGQTDGVEAAIEAGEGEKITGVEESTEAGSIDNPLPPEALLPIEPAGADNPAEEQKDDPVNDMTLEEEAEDIADLDPAPELDYGCVSEEGRHAAVIYRNGYPYDVKEAPTKYEAMVLRDTAKAAGATKFPD